MIEQGSPEWLQQRLGMVTASRISDVLARTKTGYGASRKNYMAQLVVERMTGQPQESYTNAAMQWGIDHEAEARSTYEFMSGNIVIPAEFIRHQEIEMSGASPDGVITDDGIVELKCPNTATHIETLLTKSVEDKYIMQMLWQMECSNRGWCDYVSYDPRMPPELSLFVKRVERDQARIDEIKKEVLAFLGELSSMVDKLNQLKVAS